MINECNEQTVVFNVFDGCFHYSKSVSSCLFDCFVTTFTHKLVATTVKQVYKIRETIMY